MSDELLSYYNRELSYVRKLFKEFAEGHPETAAVLRVAGETIGDPHIERMIMAFAYLTARIRFKLDDDFPELTEALLGVLYPHYLRPVPSMAIAQLVLDPEQKELTQGYPVEAGTRVDTEPVLITGSRSSEACTYRTAYPVMLWPVELTGARLSRRPFASPAAPAKSSAVLKLELKCLGEEMTFSKLKIPKLRFFLKGQAQHVLALYELVFNNTVDVTLAGVGRDPQSTSLGISSILPVGFSVGEGLLPYPPQSFLGYRLLTEYFAFPEKFCFFDLAWPAPAATRRLGNKIEVCLYFDRTSLDLENNISADTFQLGCTPIINLFRQSAEPIQLTNVRTEYPVVADFRKRPAREIYSIDAVTATSPSGKSVPYQPFHSFKHAQGREGLACLWHATRRPSSRTEDAVDHGTDVYLSLVDFGMEAAAPAGWTAHVETTCLNRDLPGHLPFGGGRPKLRLIDGTPVISKVACLTPPTPTLRLAQGNGARWRLMSHLLLNHLSISGGPDGAQALREILKLYDYVDSPVTQARISSILGITSRRAVGRSSETVAGGICRGVEVSLKLDEEAFPDNGLFLFAAVLERFLGLYATVNSFTQLTLSTNKRLEPVRRWLPRAGEKVLA